MTERVYRRGAQPHIEPDNIDGPLLVMRDGRLHWLTSWERFLLAVGWYDRFEGAYILERKYWRKA